MALLSKLKFQMGSDLYKRVVKADLFAGGGFRRDEYNSV